MKGLVGLVVFAAIVVGLGYWAMGTLLADESILIGYACGNPNEEKQEIQIFVAMATPHQDPPKLRPDGNRDWPRWVKEHFIVTASNGDVVELDRKSFANLIPSVGTEDSFLVGWVRTGETYTFDFVPVVGEKTRYRKTFTVAAEGVPFCRERFDPVGA